MSPSRRLDRLQRPISLSFWAILGVLALAPEDLAAQALFDKTLTWTAASQVNDACASVPYSIVGPGRFRVRFAMDPTYRRDFFNRSDALYTVTIHEAWKETRRVDLVNGQPAPADARWDFAIGKPSSSDVEWSVPAAPFKGVIEICSPVDCNLASCNRRAAMATLKVDFGLGTGEAGPGPGATTGGQVGNSPAGAGHGESSRPGTRGEPAPAGTSGPSERSRPAAGTARPQRQQLAGDWSFVANDYPGWLEFTVSGRKLGGRVYYEATKQWEMLADLEFDAASGAVAFARPWPGRPQFQRYSGYVRGSVIEGTFSDTNSPSQVFTWRATRQDGDPGEAGRDAAWLLAATRPWRLTGEGLTAILQFDVQGGELSAKAFFDDWERLFEVRFAPATGEVLFARRVSPDGRVQQFSGRLTRDREAMSGTFSDTYSPGRQFPWKAER